MMKLWNEFDRMVVFDTETTGIEFDRDRIIEIGAVALKEQGESGDFNALIRLPEGRTLPPFITQLTGITDEQLAREGVDDRTAAEGFCRLLEGAERPLLVAYNEQFDLNFLSSVTPAEFGLRAEKAAVFRCPDGVSRPAGLSP